MENSPRILHRIWVLLSCIRLTPHIFFMKFHSNKEIIRLDLYRWSSWRSWALGEEPDKARGTIYSFVNWMTFYPEYRSLFYYRIGWISRILSPLCPPLPTLYIVTRDIGPGLFIGHGFSTIISAEKIGQNCSIYQQVTIGNKGHRADVADPKIGDNVTIWPGAKVIGDVRIGDNSVVGANAVVVKDVPENCTVVGVPAYIVRRNEVKTKEPL